MTPAQERWAEALAVERVHGDSATAFIAARIVCLGYVQDWAGVARWREIAWKLDELRNNSQNSAV